ILATYPDVRVFNLSFSNHQPLNEMADVPRRERLRLMRDLDNFIFANDVIVVAAAGNSDSGFQPAKPYPDHIDEPGWRLGSWTAGFNVHVCGSFVKDLHPNGLVQRIGWPSPFTRVGPGIANSPVPDFSAPGGNWNSQYNFAPGLGVISMNPQGMWEDRSGTSLAVPILAREAAKTLHHLQQYVCQSGSRPFGVTVRAFLTLTAESSTSDVQVKELAARTLGYGVASVLRLRQPKADSAVVIWQGEMNGPKDLVRVNIPVPHVWLHLCDEPRLRLVACWDTPVNDAVSGLWACRAVRVHLRPGPDAKAIRPVRGPSHPSYPVLDRTYKLNSMQSTPISGDNWLVDLSYDEIAEYFAPMDFTPSQRIGLAIELFDAGESQASPQPALQAMSNVQTMTHLSQIATPVRQPVVIRAQTE
ncbi:MAG: S8 family serine peptidase, partial [Planctomycetaceae bacterium]|nr:S8 family serine peptidase [Planctomycetaceae bacterium]